jgi:hypothetical protein
VGTGGRSAQWKVGSQSKGVMISQSEAVVISKSKGEVVSQSKSVVVSQSEQVTTMVQTKSMKVWFSKSEKIAEPSRSTSQSSRPKANKGM